MSARELPSGHPRQAPAGELAPDVDEPLDEACLTEGAVRARAWLLRDRCYASWSSDPQGAVRAAEALGRLHSACAARSATAGALPEVEALAAWTAGIAQLIQGRMEAAAASFDYAAEAFIATGQPRPAAQTQIPKIMALAMLGRHDEAARCAEAAQAALLAQGDLHAAAKVQLNLGNLHVRSERHAQAVPCLREAAVLFARSGDHEHSIMADLGLADARSALGELDEAARMYARARMRAQTHGLPVLVAIAEEAAALLELMRGRYREALAGLEHARRRYEELRMPQHLAIAEKQLADAYLELRLLPEALAGLDAALARFGVLGMQVDAAWTQLQRGRVLALQGRRGAAAQALTLGAAAFAAQGDAVGAAAAASARAELALAAGDARGALAEAREAAGGFGRAGLVQRKLRADCICAQALLRLHEPEAALALFDATLEAARQHELLPVQLRCLTGRAVGARLAGHAEAGRADLEAAVEIFEAQRRTLPGDEVRSAFQDDHLQPFEELLRLALALHEAGRGPARHVLEQLDRFRARTLADRLGAAGGEAGAAGVVAVDAGREPRALDSGGPTGDLRAHLAWLYRRLQRTQEEAGPDAPLAAELRATERELLERVRRERLTAADHGGADTDSLDLAALQRRMGAADALVEYGVVDDELFACVLTAQGVHVRRRVAPWLEVLEVARAARFQLESLRFGSNRLQPHMAELQARTQVRLQHLHTLLWQPLAAALAGVQRVMVVPHAQLGSIPFAALHDGRCSLAERLQIAHAPSARLALRGLHRPVRTPRSVLVLVAPDDRLPHARREADGVMAGWPQGRLLAGNEATVPRLRAHEAEADVLHLVCHAQFRADSPSFSALHLHDGALTAEAVAALRLAGVTVVLSACETGLHDTGGGDEMFGLTRAFMAAGAARVFASLWAVDDAMTADFMVDLHGRLRSGDTPAQALRRAQLQARQRHTHPACWAAFVLVGGW